MSYADPRIVARHDSLTVLDQPQSIIWNDGSSVTLYRVQLRGIGQAFLRALHQTDGHWLVFDLRSTARVLDLDLRAAPARDADGVVLFTLRQFYTGAALFIAKAFANPHAIWLVPCEQFALDLQADPAPTRFVAYKGIVEWLPGGRGRRHYAEAA